MGRKSDYENLHRKYNKEECTFDQVKDKFGREPMSTAEFAVYLSEISGFHIDEKTVKNRIKAICEASGGALSNDDFRKDASDIRSKYELKPKYHATLLTLVNTDYFDGRRNDRLLSTRAELYKQLTSNIEKYLPEPEKKEVKSNPSYVNAVLEEALSEHINRELGAVLRSLYHIDSVMRYAVMIHFLDNLRPFRQWVEFLDYKEAATRMECSNILDHADDDIYQKRMFESETLDEFLIHYLALQVHHEKYEYVSDDETLSMSALYLLTHLFPVVGIDKNSSVSEMLQQIEAQIENKPRYQELTEKAERILDLHDPAERKIFLALKDLIKMQYLCPEVVPEEHNRMTKYTELVIAEDKWDLIHKLAQLGRMGMSDEELKAMVDMVSKNK